MKTWFHRLFLALVLVCVSHAAFANSCVWVAGTNNWSSSASWTTCGSVAPTSADTCTIAGVGTLTVDGTSGSPNICGATDFTGFTGTLTMASAKELDIYGSLTLVSGMTYTPNVASILKFKATSGTSVITTGTKSLGGVTFDGVGGTFQFADNVGIASGGVTWTYTNGSLDLNGKTFNNAANAFSISSNNSNTRVWTLGAAAITLVPNGASTVWDVGATGLTFSGASSTITIVPATTATIFNGAGLTYGTISSTNLSTGTLTINGANSMATLTLSGSVTTGAYKFGANQTISGTCTGNGGTAILRDYWTSDTKGTARTISCGTSTFTNADFQDITAAGAATWSLAAITGGSGNCGNNTNITFTTPISAYHKTAVSDNWSAANWYTASGGSTPISPQQFPLCQDTAIFDANSVTAGSKTITIDASALRISSMNWTGVLNTPALAFTTAASYFGSITLVSGMTVSGTGLMTLEGRGSQTITTAAQTMTAGITVNAPSSTWTLSDAMTSSRATSVSFTSSAGTFAIGANNLTFTGASAWLNVNGGTVTSSSTISLTGTTAAVINVAAGDLNMPSGVISMTGASSTTQFTGGTAEIGTLTRTGFALTIAGTAVQLGTGGAAFATPLTISSGSIAPTTGNKITSVSSTAIAVSANSGGGSCSFGDAGQWRDWNEANDNVRYRRAM